MTTSLVSHQEVGKRFEFANNDVIGILPLAWTQALSDSCSVSINEVSELVIPSDQVV